MDAPCKAYAAFCHSKTVMLADSPIGTRI